MTCPRFLPKFRDLRQGDAILLKLLRGAWATVQALFDPGTALLPRGPCLTLLFLLVQGNLVGRGYGQLDKPLTVGPLFLGNQKTGFCTWIGRHFLERRTERAPILRRLEEQLIRLPARSGRPRQRV